MGKSNKRWLEDHRRDEFVNKARQHKLRSRAVFKLQEMDQRFRLFKPGQTVIDLGAAPGSWCCYVSEKVGGSGNVIAIDRLAIQPIPNVTLMQGDVRDNRLIERCLACLNGSRADLVISDMAPNLTGIAETDQANSVDLAETTRALAERALKEGGDVLIKFFQGQDSGLIRAALSERFQKVIHYKPKASRADSSEMYVLGRGYDV